MSQPVYLPWPFIPQDGKRNFFNPAPGVKAPQWTEPWIIADRRPTKRRRCEKEEAPASAQPSPTSPAPTCTSYRSSQTNRVRKSYAGPRYVDQARFRPRVSDIGDHIIQWARREVPQTLRRACLSSGWLRLPRNLMDWLTCMRHEHLARRTKTFCRHIKGDKQTRIPKDIVREMRDEAQGKKKHMYQATVEDAENSEEIACADGPVMVEGEDVRTLVRDGKDQHAIYNRYEEENMSDDDDKTNDESSTFSSSDSLNSSGSYPGEVQAPPSPPTSTVLPWYLIPARIPKSTNTARKNRGNASASKGCFRASTRTKPKLTLNSLRPMRPSRLLNQSQLLSRLPLPETPWPTLTPSRINTSSRASPTLTPTNTSSIWQNAIMNAKAEGVRLGKKRAAAAKSAAERRRRSAQILGRVKNPLAMTPASDLTSETAQNLTTKSVVAPPASSKDVQTRATSNSQPNASPPLTPLEARLRGRIKAWKEQSQITKPVPQRASRESTSLGKTEVANRSKTQENSKQPTSKTLPLNPLYTGVSSKMNEYSRQSRTSQSEASASLRDSLLRDKKTLEQLSQSSHTPQAQPVSNPGLGKSILGKKKKNLNERSEKPKQSKCPQESATTDNPSLEEALVCPRCTFANIPLATYCQACDAFFIVPAPRSHAKDYMEPALSDDEDDCVMHIRPRQDPTVRGSEYEMTAAAGPAGTMDRSGNLVPLAPEEVEQCPVISQLRNVGL